MRAPRSTVLRRIAVPLLAAVGLTLTMVSPALAGSSSPPVYLALGDSVPFGYFEAFDPTAGIDQFVGYPDYVAKATRYQLMNASCPGETTDSFINSAALSNGCENRYLALNLPLHVVGNPDYPGAESQFAFAKQILTTPGANVRLVSIMLGANDGFLCANVPEPVTYCSGPTDYVGIAQHVRMNLNTILQGLRGTGYSGPIIVVTYYSLNYASAQENTGVLLLNGGIDAAALANRASIASGYLAFLFPSLRYGGNPYAAGLVRWGDVHPTDLGQQVLARAVEAVIPR